VRRRFFLIGLVAVAAGCSTSPRVETDHDPAADFSRYQTYTWAYSAAPRGMNPLLYERVRGSIDRSLAARGFTQQSAGDFAVAFTLGARDKVEVTDFGPYAPFYPGYGWGWGGMGGMNRVDVNQYTEGTLTIDVYDAATKKPVWHGVATQNVSGTPDQESIDTAVDSVLARFPPSGSGG
jgi:hypothetical protein